MKKKLIEYNMDKATLEAKEKLKKLEKLAIEMSEISDSSIIISLVSGNQAFASFPGADTELIVEIADALVALTEANKDVGAFLGALVSTYVGKLPCEPHGLIVETIEKTHEIFHEEMLEEVLKDHKPTAQA